MSFFYTGQIFESQFLHPKILKNTHLLQQMVPKSAKYAVFCIQSGKFYTGQNIFTQAPPMVPVTNKLINYLLYMRLINSISPHFDNIRPPLTIRRSPFASSYSDSESLSLNLPPIVPIPSNCITVGELRNLMNLHLLFNKFCEGMTEAILLQKVFQVLWQGNDAT